MMSRDLLIRYKNVRDRMKLPLKIYVCLDLFQSQGETLIEVVTLFRKEDEEYYNLALKHSKELCQRQREKWLCGQED